MWTLGVKSIKDLLSNRGVVILDPEDSALSGGEHAQAVIVAALIEHWDRLDGYSASWMLYKRLL